MNDSMSCASPIPPTTTTPNRETVEALRQAESEEGLTEWDSLEEMKAVLG